MSLPVRPPILFKAFVIPSVALLTPDPADDVTRERPSDALAVAFEAVSFALEAVLDTDCVAWEVVDALRRAERRRVVWGRRSTARETAKDMTNSPGRLGDLRIS